MYLAICTSAQILAYMSSMPVVGMRLEKRERYLTLVKLSSACRTALLRTLSNDQLKHASQLSGSEQDGSSECVVQSLTDSSGVSFELNKLPHPQTMSCTINNIYIIGNLNASVIKLGESSFEKVSTTTKMNNSYFPTTFTPTTQSSCDNVDTRSSKSRMPEYFDKGKSSVKPKMISNDHPAGYEHTTDNIIRATCHCHSVNKE
ncbi:Hypothetical protein CINCED_3A004051 [Cinara cedri]|uniref:Uncharacterized protein n=1 Tax=Cinara cedri TaxID=506608 RepID=A0A5E4M135_9HEMI|nr:Hypothetical protein CINCED_3A004051 [Cinara cedri]